MDDNHFNCRCWRCWLQDNFTAVALFFIVIAGLTLVVILMHEEKIDDKYVTWLEGFVAGAFSTWTLSLKSPAEKPHALAPGTTEATFRQEPPAPPAPASEPTKDTPKA